MKTGHLQWWSNLRHGGLLLDLQRLSDLVPEMPPSLPEWKQDRLRREVIAFQDDPGEKRSRFISYVLEDACGFDNDKGQWHRGSHIDTSWTRRALTGESLRPNHLWLGKRHAALPVFIDAEKRVGIGRGKRVTSRALQWLRQGDEQLALITNGYQWRIVFAGLDYDAWSEWELDQWLAEGRLSDEFAGLRAILAPGLWTPPADGDVCLLLAGVNDSRKGQADLSKELGERVRQAAELLIDGHTPALNPRHTELDAQDIYRAAVRVIMRMVVVLFAESREGLLPRDNRIFHGSYSLQGLRELLDRTGPSRLVGAYSAWPRILALFRLISEGSSHEAVPVPEYGGELFAPGRPDDSDGMKRALHLFETACFEQDLMNDALVRQVLERLTRTKVRIRQGRTWTDTPMPVDFSSLDSEYIGILYEGLLDFELRCAVDGQPIVFLAVGNQPALPLTTLEAMDDRAVKDLFEKLKDTSSKGDDATEEEGEEDVDGEEEEVDGDQWTVDGEEPDTDSSYQPPATAHQPPPTAHQPPPTDHRPPATGHQPPTTDHRFSLRARAEQWAQHAVEVAKLLNKPRGKLTPEKKMAWERDLASKARQLVTKVVMPGEWYLVRWGGTRKGSGTFYTRPQLAVPTVHRTLEPLCYEVDGGSCVVDGERGESDGGTKLRGTGSLAAGHGTGDHGVSGDKALSERRTLRTHDAASAGCSVSALEHRGGAGASLDKGIPEPPVDSKGIAHGSPDTGGDSEAPGIPEAGDNTTGAATDGNCGETSERSDSRPQRKTLTTNHKPQTTKRRPRRPEDILALKVCDPACGSGSFPLAALRYLTNALLESLVVHGRIKDQGGQAVLELIYDEEGKELLAGEKLPCRPDDEEFEVRTKAVLRRYVVERCIYGVDLDPLAVELCRLSLWIETLDRNLPLTFLNHKIKCGNSLVGAWFDQFLHYPAMAWEREGGDKSHGNGVHYKKEAWTKAIKARMNEVKAELKAYIDGGTLFYPVDLSTVRTEHDAAAQALREIHGFGVAQVRERAARYEALVNDPDFIRLRDAFDLWCALWFWPPEELAAAPMPLAFASGELSEEAREIARRVAAERRFFHWELEFPDVFAESPSSPTTNHQSPATNPATGHRPPATGFDAVLGNPPWDIAKPNSKEFFSAIDPLYRSYGKQEALSKQKEFFRAEESIEARWLDYNAFFRAMSNWMKYAGRPFGDRVTRGSNDRETHDLNLGDRGRSSFESSAQRHARWKQKREETTGYADADHAFQHQGSGDINLYKMFLEQAHALLRSATVASGQCPVGSQDSTGRRPPATGHRPPATTHQPPTTNHQHGGRLGLIVPSGLYSDHGTRDLRRLFLDQCQWEWIFGFENRGKIFDIDSRFKFNPVIVQKGVASGQCPVDDEAPSSPATGHRPPATSSSHRPPATNHLRVAFMRRDLSDWERAEDFATVYPRARVVQFSPKSLAILEIQSERDLEVLTKIYSNSVLLGDQSENGWGIKYATEFHMTNDSKLFPPRPKWEEWGYRPDEYSRWIKGPWKPIEQLYAELGVQPLPEGQHRCAQPPYHELPVPRADIPEGILLSHEATQYLHEDDIPEVTFTNANGRPLKIKIENENGEKEEVEVCGPAVALPLYEGRMIGQFDFSQKGWVSGSGRTAEWRDIPWNHKAIEPQYLMGFDVFAISANGRPLSHRAIASGRAAFMDVSSATNSRTMISGYAPNCPLGNKVPVFELKSEYAVGCVSVLSSLAYDFALRCRFGGLSLNYYILDETVLPPPSLALGTRLREQMLGANAPSQLFSGAWLRLAVDAEVAPWRRCWAISEHERRRALCILDACAFALYGLSCEEVLAALAQCDWPTDWLGSAEKRSRLNPKGFWRVDKDKHPEHRHTVLTLVAFRDLQEKIAACGGDVEKGIEAFCTQNDGEGWMLPETLRLADYGLGHDDRAKEHQPVRECFGPRFYDWQLAQSPEESWRECHLHARNLLGKEGYQALLDELEGKPPADAPGNTPKTPRKTQRPESRDARGQLLLDGSGFNEDIPLLAEEDDA